MYVRIYKNMYVYMYVCMYVCVCHSVLCVYVGSGVCVYMNMHTKQKVSGLAFRV